MHKQVLVSANLDKEKHVSKYHGQLKLNYFVVEVQARDEVVKQED